MTAPFTVAAATAKTTKGKGGRPHAPGRESGAGPPPVGRAVPRAGAGCRHGGRAWEAMRRTHRQSTSGCPDDRKGQWTQDDRKGQWTLQRTQVSIEAGRDRLGKGPAVGGQAREMPCPTATRPVDVSGRATAASALPAALGQVRRIRCLSTPPSPPPPPPPPPPMLAVAVRRSPPPMLAVAVRRSWVWSIRRPDAGLNAHLCSTLVGRGCDSIPVICARVMNGSRYGTVHCAGYFHYILGSLSERCCEFVIIYDPDWICAVKREKRFADPEHWWNKQSTSAPFDDETLPLNLRVLLAVQCLFVLSGTSSLE